MRQSLCDNTSSYIYIYIMDVDYGSNKQQETFLLNLPEPIRTVIGIRAAGTEMGFNRDPLRSVELDFAS